MAIEPIRSASEHDAALREIERLWGAPQGTRKGDRLDVLLALVETYEQTHYPIDPPDVDKDSINGAGVVQQ
jgi:HTH-type transcriptional regulator/antitoxin HigA